MPALSSDPPDDWDLTHREAVLARIRQASLGNAADGARVGESQIEEVVALINASIETARTMVVNTLAVLGIFYLFNVRYLHMSSITLRGVCPISLDAALRKHIDVSAAAACKSLGGERSHVLEAMGIPDDGAVVRIALGKCNSEANVQFAAQLIADAAHALLGVGCEIPASSDKPKA